MLHLGSHQIKIIQILSVFFWLTLQSIIFL